MKKNLTMCINLYLVLILLLVASCKTEEIQMQNGFSITTNSLNASGQFIETPRRASDFVNSIGVNTHLKVVPSLYHDKFDEIVYPKLKALGIKNIRDIVPYKSFMQQLSDTALVKNRFIKLYDSLGIKVTYTLDSKKVVDSANLRDNANYLSVFKNSAKLRQTIQTLEGFNEPDLTIYSWYPTKWDTLTYKVQKGLYTTAHAMPELAGIKILNASLVAYFTTPSRPNKVAAFSPSISTYFDYANFHNYDSGSSNMKMFPGSNFDLTKMYYPPIQNGKPFITTEFGYENAHDWNLPTSPGYVASGLHYLSELSSGKYYSIAFMELLKRGAIRAFAYEFIDANTSDQTNAEKNFGLIHSDGTPKPAYTAIKNTIDLLNDANTTFTPTALTYTISGDTTNIRRYLFQKSDGRYYLALWQGLPAGINYDFPNFHDLPADTQTIQITFTQPYATVKTYMPMVSATAITSGINIVTMSVAVPDQLLIIELKPL